MKSYLHGNPTLQLGLNRDLVIGRSPEFGAGGVVIEDCNFHDSVQTGEFLTSKLLNIEPPSGEFVVMNYRGSSYFTPPFSVIPILSQVTSFKFEMNLVLKACFSSETTANFVLVTFSLPKSHVSYYN